MKSYYLLEKLDSFEQRFSELTILRRVLIVVVLLGVAGGSFSYLMLGGDAYLSNDSGWIVVNDKGREYLWPIQSMPLHRCILHCAGLILVFTLFTASICIAHTGVEYDKRKPSK